MPCEARHSVLLPRRSQTPPNVRASGAWAMFMVLKNQRTRAPGLPSGGGGVSKLVLYSSC